MKLSEKAEIKTSGYEIRRYTTYPRTTLRVQDASSLNDEYQNDRTVLMAIWSRLVVILREIDTASHDGVNNGEFLIKFQHHYYPKPEKELRLGQHSDGLNAFVLPATEGLLEVYDGQNWHSISLEKDQGLFIPGKAALMSTFDKVVNVEHRVRAISDNERYSAQFAFRRY